MQLLDLSFLSHWKPTFEQSRKDGCGTTRDGLWQLQTYWVSLQKPTLSPQRCETQWVGFPLQEFGHATGTFSLKTFSQSWKSPTMQTTLKNHLCNENVPVSRTVSHTKEMHHKERTNHSEKLRQILKDAVSSRAFLWICFQTCKMLQETWIISRWIISSPENERNVCCRQT